MLDIQINGLPFQLGQLLPAEVHSLVITIGNFPPIQVPSHQVPLIKSWIKDLQSKLTCDYITYNHTLIPTKDFR